MTVTNDNIVMSLTSWPRTGNRLYVLRGRNTATGDASGGSVNQRFYVPPTLDAKWFRDSIHVVVEQILLGNTDVGTTNIASIGYGTTVFKDFVTSGYLFVQNVATGSYQGLALHQKFQKIYLGEITNLPSSCLLTVSFPTNTNLKYYESCIYLGFYDGVPWYL